MSRIPRPAAPPSLFLALALAAGCAGSRDLVDRPAIPDSPLTFTPAGAFDFAPLGRFPPGFGLRFGGISGLAALAGGRELLGISDDRDGLRVYRFGLRASGTDFQVVILGRIALDAPAAPSGLDPEAIAILPDSNLLIASDGVGNEEPRVPPAIVEYTRHGSFVRALPVRERFAPNPAGPLAKGVRANLGFESLTLAPGGQRFYAATESAIVQDGEPSTFEPGAPARILEYVRDGDSFEPRREFAYLLDPLDRPEFEPGVAVNGLVELLSLGGEELLALERSYIEEAGDATGRRSLNRIRLFRVALGRATDVSNIDSLGTMSGIAPADKQLVLDLSDTGGLPPGLTPGLDNFEGLTFGPRLPDGRATLILVSDDNFNAGQRTWFLRFAVGDEPGRDSTGAIQ